MPSDACAAPRTGTVVVPTAVDTQHSPVCDLEAVTPPQLGEQQGSDQSEVSNPIHEIMKLLSTRIGRTYFPLGHFHLCMQGNINTFLFVA